MSELDYVEELSEDTNKRVDPRLRKQILKVIRDIVYTTFRSNDFDSKVLAGDSELVMTLFKSWQEYITRDINKITTLENEYISLRNRMNSLENRVSIVEQRGDED